MLNCCGSKQQHNSDKTIDSTPNTKRQSDPDQKLTDSKPPSNERMPTKSPGFHVFSSNSLKFFRKRSKLKSSENSLKCPNSQTHHDPCLTPVQSPEHVSTAVSKADESENMDSLGKLPFSELKYSGVKISSNVVIDHSVPTTTVAASRRGSLYIFRHSDDLIVTPFAQILASLRNVRANFILITNVQSSREARFGSISASSHTLKSDEMKLEGDDRQWSLTMETLDELEWCLERLESIQTHRSVSDMASSKFKKILNKELSQYADQSKSGNQISDYICTTFLDADGDTSLDQTSDYDDAEAAQPNSSRAREDIDEHSETDCSERYGDGAPLSVSTEHHKIHRPTVSFKPPPFIDNEDVCTYGIKSIRHDEMVEVIERTLDTWGMDIFLVSTLSDNRPLTVISFALFRKFKLFEKFSIQSSIFLNFITEIENKYHKDVPYHNSTHAADVTQSTNVLLGALSLENVFSDLEVMSVIFACIIHDVDHPGVTNQYLINTNDQLALMYNDASVLENHHLSVAFTALSLPNCDIIINLTKKQRQSFRKMVIDMVLATDMSKHMSLLADLKTMVETKKVAGSGILNLDNYNDRIQILQNMVHCADLSNPTKPLLLYRSWTEKIMQEFFRQGDKERTKNLEISPMCDRQTATVEKSQVSFIDFIVHPLWETWSDLVYPEAQDILDTLEENREWYFSQISKIDDKEPSENDE